MERGKKMEKLFITFRSEEDIIAFVEVCCEYDDAIDIRVGKMLTDAKSILGMLLLKTGETFEIEYGCYDSEDNYSQFREEILKKFQVTVKGEPDKRTSMANL